MSWLRQVIRFSSRTAAGGRNLEPLGRIKVLKNAEEALSVMKDGQTIACGGFGLCGVPMTILKAMAAAPIKDLILISNNAGTADWGIGVLLERKQIRRMISSYVGENALFEGQYLGGELELEMVPQGVLAERLRAAGAGIPAFFSPCGYNTYWHHGKMPILYDKGGNVIKESKVKEMREFGGRKYLMEESLPADVGIIKAYKADTAGNLIFRHSAYNFNAVCAKASKYTIAEVEEIVPAGELDPNEIHLSGVYVHSLLVSDPAVPKKLERTRLANHDKKTTNVVGKNNHRDLIARRAALDLVDGMYVNLGIGIPVLVASFADPKKHIWYMSENGVLGVGDYPDTLAEADSDLINASKESIKVLPGATFFSSDEAFGMIRGGHLNMTILGAMQVSSHGDIANWMIPRKLVKGVGGAMDLVTAGKTTKVTVVMEHNAKDGSPKILDECALPLTGLRCVSRIITEKAVFDVDPEKGLTLIEAAAGLSPGDIEACTGARFTVSPNFTTITYAPQFYE